jgi:hypothetical protein
MNTQTEPEKRPQTATNTYYASLDDELRCSEAGRRFPSVEGLLQPRPSADYCFWHDPAWHAEVDTTTLGESE